MGSYKEIYEIEFITRTKEFLEDYQKKGDYKLTILLNCMVGLIFIPNERNKYDYPPLWKSEIQNIPIFKQNNIYPATWTQKGNITLEQFIRKLRNGIAHQNIKPINRDDQFTGVKIWNIKEVTKKNSKKKEKVIDFKIALSRKELLIVANFIAEQYLIHIDQAKKKKIIAQKEP